MDVNAEQFINGLVQVMGMNDPSELGNLFSNNHKPMNEMNDIQRTITNMFKIVSLIFKTNDVEIPNVSSEETKEQVGGQGLQGLQGLQGRQGRQGVPGRQGPPGKDGKSGKDGKDAENHDSDVFEWASKEIIDNVDGRIVYMNCNGKIELVNDDSNEIKIPIGVVVEERNTGAYKMSGKEQGKKYSWINNKGVERVSTRKPPKGTSFKTVENKKNILDDKSSYAHIALRGMVDVKIQINDKLDERWIVLDGNKLFLR
tara:strand:- start:855 stop:1625 length:771 start_codon:yes stop_codon:yes gene_type:complete